MIQLVKGEQKNVVVTLTEKTTLVNPYYLFVFTHQTTKEVVKFIINSSQDLSGYPNRYNEFLFDSTLFTAATKGKWQYVIYEQTSATNTNPSLATGEVENGKMDLNDAVAFEFKKYSTTTNYKQYGG